MNKVIITGACGFLGRKLTETLINQSISVFAIDCIDNFDSHNELIHYYRCDLENNLLPTDGDLENSDVLFHFAWSGVNPDYRNDYEKQIKNIKILKNILESAKVLNIKKVIILGSAAEYSKSEMPITGYNNPIPVDAYGAIKSACHIISNTWSLQNKLPIIWVIPSSIYGPGRNDNNVLTYTIKALLKNVRPAFTSLEQEWDFIYIDDFINAIILIAKKGITGKSYALGNGDSRKLKDYVFKIRNIINPELPLGIGEIPYKGGIPDNSEMDISELIKDTDFKPEYNFEEGIKRTICWFKDFCK